MAKAYTAEQLKGKGLSDLRKIAKLLKINPSGKNIADLIREILKAQKISSTGKGTSADIDAKGKKPAAKRAKKPADDEDDEDEDEEEDDEDEDEEDEAPAKKTAKKSAAKKTSKKKPADDDDEDEDDEDEDDEEDSDDEDEDVDSDDEDEDDEEEEKFSETTLKQYLAKLGKKVGIPVPASWLKGGGAKGKVSKSPKAKNAKKKAADEDDDSDADDDGEPELNLSPEDLKGMSLDQLKALVGKIHRDTEIKKASKGKKVDVNTTSANELRKRIGVFLDKFAPADEEGQEESSCPSFLKDGAKVEVDIGKKSEKWVPGTVSSIDEDEETATIDLDNGDEVESPWEHLRKGNPKAKKRG